MFINVQPKQFTIMKKKMSFIFVFLVTLCCAVAIGGAKSAGNKVAIIKSGNGFKVIYAGKEESKVKVTIYDQEEHVVFAESIISNGGFIRPYNFSELPKGDYKVCVTDHLGEYSENVCNQTKHWLAHLGKLGHGINKCIVVIPHQEEVSEIEIQIYDQNQQLVYSEDQSIVSDFAKIYDLQNFEKATIQVVNKSSGEQKALQIE
jgi:flagellar hook assembly protein FlgD